MLVNNFKPLLFFGNSGTFKDVLGNEVAASSYLARITYDANRIMWANSDYVNTVNGHIISASNRAFNYNITIATNGCVDEQSLYPWSNIVLAWKSISSSMDIHSNGFTLFVGEGETPVTLEDYKLESPISLAVTSATCIHNADGTTLVTRTFYNGTGNDVTIKELGLYLFSGKSFSYVVDKAVIMIGRKVLSTPVTIPASASYTFTWKIDLVKDLQFTEE